MIRRAATKALYATTGSSVHQPAFGWAVGEDGLGPAAMRNAEPIVGARRISANS